MDIQPENSHRPRSPKEGKVLQDGDLSRRPSHFIVHEIVDIAIGDLIKKNKTRPTGSDTIFFDIVRGGNVRLAEKVLDMLKACRRRQELNMALGISDAGKPAAAKCNSVFLSTCLQFFVLLLLVVLYVILTPIWYIVHALTTSVYEPHSGATHADTELPLIYAVRSKTRDMIRMFLERGASLSHTDSKGNNVYHYIADLSAQNPQEAIKCHKCLLSAIVDVKDVCDVIMTQTNDLGLTPFETIAKYGSLQLFNCIVREDGIFGRAVLYSSRDTFQIDVNSNRTVGYGRNPISDEENICPVECSRTLRHSSGRQDGDEQADDENRVSLARHRFDISQFEKGDIHGKQSYILQQVAARDIEGLSQTEVESLSDAKFLKHWMRDKQRVFFRSSILVHIFQISFTILLLVYLALNAGDGDLYPLRVPATLKDLSAAYKNIDEFNIRNKSTNITVYDIGKGQLQGQICPRNYKSFGGHLLDKCMYEAFTEIKTRMCTRLTEREILNTIDADFVDPEDQSQIDRITNISEICYQLLFAITVAYLAYDISFRLLFLVNSYSRVSFFDSRVHIASRLLATFQKRIPGSYIKKQLNVTAHCLIVLHEALKQTYREREYMIKMTDEKYKAGDHFDREAFRKDIESEAAYMENFADRVRYTVMACLMMRLLGLVLSLRVLPSVGFFVITTLKLAKILVNFLVVFSMIAMSFASVFHFVMRDPKCQGQKLKGFNSLTDSLLQTYTVMLGQGSIVQSQNISATIAYVMYTTITCLLLLNLIIAVMGTMVDALNRQPWRDMLCLMEHWEQTLGAEATMQTLLYPLRFCSRRGRALYHRLTGTYPYGEPSFVEVDYTE